MPWRRRVFWLLDDISHVVQLLLCWSRSAFASTSAWSNCRRHLKGSGERFYIFHRHLHEGSYRDTCTSRRANQGPSWCRLHCRGAASPSTRHHHHPSVAARGSSARLSCRASRCRYTRPNGTASWRCRDDVLMHIGSASFFLLRTPARFGMWERLRLERGQMQFLCKPVTLWNVFIGIFQNVFIDRRRRRRKFCEPFWKCSVCLAFRWSSSTGRTWIAPRSVSSRVFWRPVGLPAVPSPADTGGSVCACRRGICTGPTWPPARKAPSRRFCR